MMTPKAKIILGIVLAIVVIGLAWWFFGSIAAAITSLFGGGAMRQYLKIEQANQARKDQIAKQTQAQLDVHNAQTQAQQQQLQQQLQQRFNEINNNTQRQTQQANQNTDQAINKARTPEEVDNIEDAALRDHEAFLQQFQPKKHPLVGDLNDKESGRIGRGVLVTLALLGALAFSVWTPRAKAHEISTQELAAKKERAKRRLHILNTYKAQIVRLQKRIQALQAHTAKACEFKVKAAAKREQIVRSDLVRSCQSDLRACQQQKLILASPPPLWPHYLGAIGGTAALCIVAFGIREGTRGNGP